jgi:hypothetical protein
LFSQDGRTLAFRRVEVMPNQWRDSHSPPYVVPTTLTASPSHPDRLK